MFPIITTGFLHGISIKPYNMSNHIPSVTFEWQSLTYFFASPIGSLSPKRYFRSSNVPRRSTFFSCWLSVLLTIWFLNVVNGLFAPVQYSKYYKLHIHYRELNLTKKRLSTESLSNIYKILFFKKVSNYRD